MANGFYVLGIVPDAGRFVPCYIVCTHGLSRCLPKVLTHGIGATFEAYNYYRRNKR